MDHLPYMPYMSNSRRVYIIDSGHRRFTNFGDLSLFTIQETHLKPSTWRRHRVPRSGFRVMLSHPKWKFLGELTIENAGIMGYHL